VRLAPGRDRARIEFAPELDREGNFVSEALFWAARLRFEELRLSDDHPWTPAYLRIFLGRCDLFGTDASTACYPMIKLYDSGVVLVELRFIGPRRPIPVKEFIRKYVNLHTTPLTLLRVPPGLGRLLGRSQTQNARNKWPLRRRRHLVRLWKLMDRGFDEVTATYDDGDFQFDLAPINRGEGEDTYDTLHSFALGVVDAMAHVLGGPRSDVGTLLLGVRPALRRGDFWTGRPHIHIVRHAEQAVTAQDNEAQHRADFGWILARTWYRSEHALGANYLPENHRTFGDYALYVSQAAFMWVWARKGLAPQSQWADPNRGHLIYGQHVVAELLEYGYMLHRQLLARANGHGTPDKVLAARRELASLHQSMEQYTHFGELRSLLRMGWETLGVSALRERIAEALAVREAETALAESRSGNLRKRMLTVVFGLLAVPPLAGDVVRPFWRYMGWWRPATAPAYELLTVCVAVILVITFTQAWDAWLDRRK
jgi:hypothetical protein